VTTAQTRRALIFALSTLALTGCASGPSGPSDEVIARALKGAPGEAQPSTIVATELAYSRKASEDGYLKASRDYATEDALLHGRNGPVPFAALNSVPDDPNNSLEWSPRLVVQSCDGALALSQGRFRDASGAVGNYVTVWERQGDGSFRWSYDVAGLDDPQPAPRPPAQEGDIVVTAMDAVQGLVADCIPPDIASGPPTMMSDEEARGAVTLSPDGSLRWAWSHRSGGIKRIVADYYFEGEWQRAIEENLASSTE